VIAAVLVAAVVVAGLVGWVWWRGDGRMQRGSGEVVPPDRVGLAVDAFGDAATLLLFGSQQDGRTDLVRERLAAVASDRPGVRIAEVDLTVRGDIAGPYAVTRTPTVLVLDGDRRLVARVRGAADEEVIRGALALAAPSTG
jgi:hypothetical protein